MSQAKEYLQQVRSLGLLLNTKAATMEHVRSLAERITGNLDGVHVQGGDPAYSRVEDAAVELVDMYGEVTAELAKYASERRQAQERIDRVKDPRHRAVLELRYIACCSWEDVIKTMHYDDTWVYKLHAAALRAFDRVLARESV